MNSGEPATSSIMKLFLLVTACIIINVFLYLFEDKWIGGLFSGAWLFATVLTYLYNKGFDLNITNYSMTTLLKRYFVPILTYITWIGVIYWWIIAQNDLSENPNLSELSRNFAVVMTGFIPVLAGIVTYCSTYGKSVGWAILNSIVLLAFGSYCYYLNTLDDGCEKNISDTICWTYAANATFLSFILITGFFIWLSTQEVGKYGKIIQILPRILTTNPTSPFSIFSIITYLIIWISFIIVSFRHHDNGFFGDTVNATFTIIGIVMSVLLFFKENTYMKLFINKFIDMIMYIYNQPLSTTLLHVSIIITFIVSISFTSTYINKKPDYSNIGGIWALDIILSLLFLFYIILVGRKYYLS